ncbi:MAG: ABC transporter ATP-binding protein [Syntrophobacterales bacterium]|nr:ABC transporter ATP-binding protein [Syntrophobacterales bacterium]
MASSEVLLRVKQLKTFFFSEFGTLKAVDNVSFVLPKQKVLALVGESGCGKSVTALSLLRLIPSPPGKIVSGEAWFEGLDIFVLSESQLNNLRGNKISMVFQDPMTALNPVFTIGDQIAEVLLKHGKANKRQVKTCVLELLEQVGISSPERVYESYPHQLSGGMRQRALIAMAISCRPQILIADEPTTALDVTIQALILHLLKELQERTGLSIIFITHDLRVVAEIADEVAVMYAGKIVEHTSVKGIFDNPLHPYTKALMDSIPGITQASSKKLKAIPGSVPSLIDLPRGCAFSPRCSYALKRCPFEGPPLFQLLDHEVRCWLYEKDALASNP